MLKVALTNICRDRPVWTYLIKYPNHLSIISTSLFLIKCWPFPKRKWFSQTQHSSRKLDLMGLHGPSCKEPFVMQSVFLPLVKGITALYSLLPKKWDIRKSNRLSELFCAKIRFNMEEMLWHWWICIDNVENQPNVWESPRGSNEITKSSSFSCSYLLFVSNSVCATQTILKQIALINW